MKVFISHSWKNKTQVQRIADELTAAGIEVWLDAANLLPGQHIQDTINSVLQNAEVVVLVWSKEASGSDGVAAEVYTCSRLNKPIIPCYLDSTPVNTHPYIAQLKGIHFTDFNSGVGRLKMVLLNHMAKEFEMHGAASIKAMNEFMGTLEAADHLVHRENLKESGTQTDKDYWVGRIQDTETSSFKKLQEEEKAGKEIMPFLQAMMKRLESGMKDRQEIKYVLDEMNVHPYSNHPALRTFIDSVRKIYDSFDQYDSNSAIANYKKEMEEKLAASKNQLKASFGLLADFMFATAFENMQYFFISSASNLENLVLLSKQKNTHPVVSDCATELLQYIQAPGGVIDNKQYGILGYADDAYFIHSLISALMQEGVIDTTAWNTDWGKINAGSEVVFNIAGNHIRQQLDQNIAAYCSQLIQKYQPQSLDNEAVGQQQDELQKARDDVWSARLMSLQTAMIQNPIY